MSGQAVAIYPSCFGASERVLQVAKQKIAIIVCIDSKGGSTELSMLGASELPLSNFPQAPR